MAEEKQLAIKPSYKYLTKNRKVKDGSMWFKRFYKEVKKMSPHIRFKKIKLGFYRIYWKGAYIGECYKEMPMKGYTWSVTDPRFEYKSYYEEFEDAATCTRKVKNFIEGYYDNIEKIRKRVYLINNNKEFNERSRGAYKNMRIY